MKTYVLTIEVKARSLAKAYELLKKLLNEAKIVAFKMEYGGVAK